MKQIFDKTKAVCAECGTPLNGVDLFKRGDSYYCSADFQRTSPQEKAENRKITEANNYFKRFLSDDTGNLTLNHDFDDWTVTNGTATDKVWTSEASGQISKNLGLEFGKHYKIKVIASPTVGSIICYNSTDTTLQLGTNSFDTTFIALTEYIEFRNDASTNTISFIEVRKQ